MRLFIGIYLDEALLDEASRAQQDLKAALNSKQRAALRFIKRHRMHITLKFLGDVDAETCVQIEKQLVEIQNGADPFSLTLSGSGCFPARGPASIAWLGISASKDRSKTGGLYGLQANIEAQMSPLGYPPAFQSYIPHLTIGYIQGRKYAEEIRNRVEALNPIPLTQTVRSFALIESKLSGENIGHQILRNFEF
jgi:RNA 2',3'-cyclic 3'-phosphodiesterase